MLSGLDLSNFGHKLVNNLCYKECVYVCVLVRPCVQHGGASMCVHVLNWSVNCKSVFE